MMMQQHSNSDVDVKVVAAKENDFKRHGSNRRKPVAPKSRNVLEQSDKTSPSLRTEFLTESYNCDKCLFKTTSLWHFQLHTQHHLNKSDNPDCSTAIELSPLDDLSENDSDEPIACDNKNSGNENHIEVARNSQESHCVVLPSRKRHYNVEVDPAKYRRIEDPEEGGVKYACSICGNVYKWRKSLNKHWKEKHKAQHPPPLDAPVKIRPKSIINKTQTIYKNGHGNQSLTHPAFMSHACLMPSMNWQNPFFIMQQEMKPFENMCTNPCFYKTTNNTYGERTMQNGNDEINDHDTHSDDELPLDLSMKKETQKAVNIDEIKCEPNDNLDSAIDVTEHRPDVSSPSSTERSTQSMSNENNDATNNRNDYVNGEHNKSVVNAYGQKLFVCSVCKAKFLVLDSINDHFFQNHMEELEREIAGKSPPRNTNVAQQNEEWNLSDPKNPLKCIQCDFVGRWPTELQKHAASHSTSRPFKCLVCSLTYKWRWDLAKHFDRAHPTLVNPYKKRDRDAARSMIERTAKDTSVMRKRRLDNSITARTQVIVNQCFMPRLVPFGTYPVHPFTVPFVNSVNSTPVFDQQYNADVVVDAMNSRIEQQQQLKCTESNESDDADSSVKSCPNTISFKRKCDKEERNFICRWCDFRGRWRSELIQHMRCHHAREKPYHCSECSYASNWKWDVQKHVKKQHATDDTAKIIEIPDRLLFQANDENLEEKGHYDEDVWKKIFTQSETSKLMKCSHCPFLTCSPVELRRHLIVHSNEQPYHCFACEFKSKWKCEVKKHMKLHGHTGPILVGRKAMQKVIEKLGSKMKTVILLDNVKQMDNDDDYITDEEVEKSNFEVNVQREKNKDCREKKKQRRDSLNDDDPPESEIEHAPASHTQERARFRCFSCEYVHENAEEMKKHFEKEHENEPWPCCYCSDRFDSLSDAEAHFEKHENKEETDYFDSIFLMNWYSNNLFTNAFLKVFL